jgi:PPOX class probable F420-dependent enzyme
MAGSLTATAASQYLAGPGDQYAAASIIVLIHAKHESVAEDCGAAHARRAGSTPAERVTAAHCGGRMSKPPLPEAAVAMLRKPNPAVITTLRPDGQPVATATWYLWDDGRVLVNMDEGRKRLEHIRNDPRVALDVLDEGGWGTHVSIIGHIGEMREDTGLADIDRITGHYIGTPYPQRDRRRISAWIAVDGWHGWGALKDNSQAAG